MFPLSGSLVIPASYIELSKVNSPHSTLSTVVSLDTLQRGAFKYEGSIADRQGPYSVSINLLRVSSL